ncbi:EF-hand domain-containing protein [Actinosynnema sp. CS-041913]|uniref:EF-hand domain-containing protein n=1 Tax=Actinosynnema sp. CS-041913 TaxID=3239917 RepID=UPI003D8E14E5
MSDQVRLDNIDRVFAILDLDGDGGIRWDDFGSIAEGVGGEFGLGPESPEVRNLLAGYREVWVYVSGAADLDADGVVGKDEFRQAHAAQRLSTGEVLHKWLTVSERAFELADRDGDGFLDESALAGIYRGAGVTDPQVASIAFGAMDVDGDGRLDKAEFCANVQGLFTSTDEAGKGAHMLSGN